MKILIVLLLVLAVFLVGLPFEMGMDGMAYCPQCTIGPNLMSVGLCLAILAAVLLSLNPTAVRWVSIALISITASGPPQQLLRPPQ